MTIVGVSKIAMRDRLKSALAAVSIVPDDHLDEVNQLVLGDPLHCFQPIATEAAGDLDTSARVLEGLKQ